MFISLGFWTPYTVSLGPVLFLLHSRLMEDSVVFIPLSQPDLILFSAADWAIRDSLRYLELKHPLSQVPAKVPRSESKLNSPWAIFLISVHKTVWLRWKEDREDEIRPTNGQTIMSQRTNESQAGCIICTSKPSIWEGKTGDFVKLETSLGHILGCGIAQWWKACLAWVRSWVWSLA